MPKGEGPFICCTNSTHNLNNSDNASGSGGSGGGAIFWRCIFTKSAEAAAADKYNDQFRSCRQLRRTLLAADTSASSNKNMVWSKSPWKAEKTTILCNQ